MGANARFPLLLTARTARLAAHLARERSQLARRDRMLWRRKGDASRAACAEIDASSRCAWLWVCEVALATRA